jgi:hypothetical protein
LEFHLIINERTCKLANYYCRNYKDSKKHKTAGYPGSIGPMAAQKQHPHDDDDGGSMKKKITHRSIDRSMVSSPPAFASAQLVLGV